jgi:hypothetical protein
MAIPATKGDEDFQRSRGQYRLLTRAALIGAVTVSEVASAPSATRVFNSDLGFPLPRQQVLQQFLFDHPMAEYPPALIGESPTRQNARQFQRIGIVVVQFQVLQQGGSCPSQFGLQGGGILRVGAAHAQFGGVMVALNYELEGSGLGLLQTPGKSLGLIRQFRA